MIFSFRSEFFYGFLNFLSYVTEIFILLLQGWYPTACFLYFLFWLIFRHFGGYAYFFNFVNTSYSFLLIFGIFLIFSFLGYYLFSAHIFIYSYFRGGFTPCPRPSKFFVDTCHKCGSQSELIFLISYIFLCLFYYLILFSFIY